MKISLDLKLPLYRGACFYFFYLMELIINLFDKENLHKF